MLDSPEQIRTRHLDRTGQLDFADALEQDLEHDLHVRIVFET
jgi:hypothetical protein